MVDRRPEKRQPWMKWHTRDWRADVPLRMCSYAARGLWVDLLSLMHESATYGFLLVEGVIPTVRQLAGLLGGSERKIKPLLMELGKANVYSVTGKPMPEDVEALVPTGMPDGVIFSRRMVRDKAKADCDRNNGGLGGNPGLKPPANGGVNPQANAQRAEVREQMFDEGRPNGLPSEEHHPAVPIAAREGLEGHARDAVQAMVFDLAAKKRAQQ